MGLFSILGLVPPKTQQMKGGPPTAAAASTPVNSSAPTSASSPAGNEESAFEANFKTISADLRAALADKPPDTASDSAQRKLQFANDTMLEAASEDDFKLANEYLDQLPGLIADYRAAVDAFRAKQAADRDAAKAAYEKKLAPLAAGMRRVLGSKPAAPTAKKIQAELVRVDGLINMSVVTGDYATASKDLDAVQPLIDRFWKDVGEQTTGKQEYLQQFKNIEGTLHKVIDEVPAGGPPLQLHDDLVTSAYNMEAAATGGDYATANRLLLTMAPQIDRYRKAVQTYEREIAAQKAAKTLYDKKIGPIEAEEAKIETEAPLDDATKGLKREIVGVEMQISFALTQANYVTANDSADELAGLIEQYHVARKRAQNDPKLNYERVLPTVQVMLDTALKPPRTDKFMIDMQGKVTALKAQMNKAVAAKKYDVAYPRLLELKKLLEQFQEEDRKTPQGCFWVIGVSASLSKDVQIKFNDAANKLDELADAYDRALKAHQDTLNRAKERRQLTAAILEFVFMVALPGVVGGAASAGLKKYLGDAEKSLSGGALVDGSKDSVKFVTRVFVGMAVDPPKPEKPGRINGSGVTLTRSVARELRAEQSRVLRALKELDDLLVAHEKECAKGKPIRVEGDPRQAFAGDPFLKIIGAIGAVDEKGFGTEIWREWIDRYAYQVQEELFIVTHMDPKKYHVKKAFDNDMIPEIEAQVSGGFNVKAAFEKAEKAAHDKLAPDGTMPEIA